MNAKEITINVEDGYSPDTIHASKGQPVRIIFDRQEDSLCSQEVVFPDLGIRKVLAPNGRTVVELLADKAGDLVFTCGMGMLRGKLVVS